MPTRKWPTPLPIDDALDQIVTALARRGSLVIEAPPGAGKTTRVPQALLSELEGEIIVLEPRRLAARMAADRVAFELGETAGQTVGYKVRHLERTSKNTRLTFVTEGILTRRLLSDRELRGVSCVILDEVHERHLQGDLALALLCELRRTARPDLKLCAMSATLDAAPFAAFMDAEIVRTEGRRFDVAMEYDESLADRPLEVQVAAAVRKAAKDEADGHILVFLPGAREIRLALAATESAAAAHGLTLLPLHGDLTPDEQDRAVRRGESRKAIFATNVAESSITIDGVVAVIDSGLARTATYSPWSGMSELAITKVSRASATQRAGRAGRTRAGRAIRLYSRADFETRPEQDAPEIARAELSQTALELALAGRLDLPFFEPPPEKSWSAALTLLEKLGALDETTHKVTDTGRAMLTHPLHPRIARMVVEGERRQVATSAITLAAILSEKDIRREARASFGGARVDDRATEDSDAISMLDAFNEARDSSFSRHAVQSLGLDARAVMAADNARKAMERSARPPFDSAKDRDAALRVSLLAGFPDRVTRRKRPGGRELIMPGFGAAELDPASVVRHAIFMCAIDATERRLPGERGPARPVVRIASGVEPLDILDLFPERTTERVSVEFDSQRERVLGKKELVYEGLAIDESPLDAQHDPRAQDVLFRAAKAKGFASFCAEGQLERFLLRARFAASQDPSVVPPTDEKLSELLLSLCEGRTTIAEVRSAGFFDYVAAETEGRDRIERLAPDRIKLKSGRTTQIEYETGKAPWVESYLQDFCGTVESPKAGNVPLVLHLLAPNKRAVQVTADLAGFWDRHYPQIRKELMRKYPRHAWPEDPRTVVVEPKQRR
jgi:ATP-dependent helicase HrpB